MAAPLTDRALNRATLARQGLLEPLDGTDVVGVVRAVGAVQAQQWTAVPVALAARTAGFEPPALDAALQAGDLLAGIGIRGTLHLVAADEHPVYARIAADAGIGMWARELKVVPEAAAGLAAAVLAAAAAAPLAVADFERIAEAWLADHPDALPPEEVDAQRAVKWRPLARRPDLVRVPATGAWAGKTPKASRAAPWTAQQSCSAQLHEPAQSRSTPVDGSVPLHEAAPSPEGALEAGVLAHLRAFGPASAKDVAQWLGRPVPVTRAAIERLGDALVTLEGADGRTLHDVPDGPRPAEDTPAPPRFLAAFDSLMLAYGKDERTRLIPDPLRDVAYGAGNLRIEPVFLVDGLVAGTWALDVKAKQAAIALTPAGRLAKAARTGLEREGDRLLAALAPRSKARAVLIA